MLLKYAIDNFAYANHTGEKSMFGKFTTLLKDESGATAIEYGLIAALVSVAAITALGTMGQSLKAMFTTVANALQTAVNG